jgi:hypothetical protein
MTEEYKELDPIQRAMKKYYEKNKEKIIQRTVERNRLNANDERVKEQRRIWNRNYKEKKRLLRQQNNVE